MAFQPVNFANIQPLGYSGVGRGMRVGMAPFQEARKKKAQDLVNSLTQMKMQYMPEEYASQAALRKAQTQKAMQDAAEKKFLTDILMQMSSSQPNGESALSSGGDFPSDFPQSYALSKLTGHP